MQSVVIDLVKFVSMFRGRHLLVALIGLLQLLVASVVYGGPLVAAVNRQAGTLTISGANFGIDHGATAPIFWDDFDSGVNGSNLVTQKAGSVSWTVNSQPVPTYSATQAHSGAQSAYAVHRNGLHWSHFTVGERAAPIPDSLTYYHSFWFRFNTPRPLGTVGETKLIRIFGSNPKQSLPDRPFVKSGGVGDWWTTSHAKAYDGLEPYKNWLDHSPDENMWHRVEATYRQSSAGGVADGSIQVALDGVVQASFADLITRSDSADRWIKADFFSGMTNWDTANTDLTWEKWVDDAYLSKTWQRVELCDSSTWDNRRQCELQSATAWADGQIEVNYSSGGFAGGQTVYVYVLDASGVVNINGFPLAILSQPPLPPRGVVVAPGS